MVRLTVSADGSSATFNVTVSRLAVYLDSFALFDLAEGDAGRRRRFLDTIHSGVDLLFSISNVAELIGPQEGSIDAVRAFLDDIGPHWVPVELDTVEVVDRERNGVKAPGTFICGRFLKDYFSVQLAGVPRESRTIIDPCRDLLRLGGIFDWVGEQRDSIRRGLADLDTAFINKTAERRTQFKRNPGWLEEAFPILAFRQDMPATFTQYSLVRNLILQGDTLKKNDGADFCHAILASAFANIAALDKKWKRRVDALPKPNNLAKIYCQPELDQMVAAIESLLNPPTPAL
jgi:hypothetical protein